ncbi:YkgJ family cysteine cluster protein [Fervidicoccus fontis]|uniref:YkgJ family cysteine cluster protein n=1 Tax=Fervidicoccus fontis TaxID=683846 RepID=A0A843A744_9CREN|nr:YkgJ family cysteine cluster protein [Fervidicoccus fontis]MBE9390603.1 YkgJ family cysteine cluster protein [Fervidicoccus fontis]
MFKFNCLLCGAVCCTFKSKEESPLVFPWEKRRLERLNKSSMFEPYIIYKINNEEIGVLMYRWKIEGRCLFLNREGRCTIHNSKPLSCKMFPLIIGLDDFTLRVSADCEVVKNHINDLETSDPKSSFPAEYPHAMKVFELIIKYDREAKKKGWNREIFKKEYSAHRIIDIDNLIKI